MRRLLLFLACLNLTMSHAQLLIRNTTIVDVESKKLVPGQDVLVSNGIIAGIGKSLSAGSAAVVDGSGKYLVPGLVDAHVHFFQSGSVYTRPDAIDLRKVRSYEEEIQWVHNNMEHFLRRYLAAG